MEIVKTLNWKIFVAIAFILFVIIIIFMLLFGKSTSSTTTQNTQSTTQDLVQNGKIYKAKTYTVLYPSDWQIEKIPSADDSFIILRPPQVERNDQYPLLIISVNSPTIPLEKRANVLLSLGFTKSNVTINNNIPAIEMRGVPKRLGIPETTLFIEHNSKQYVIEYRLRGDQNDSELENSFKKIISHLTFL